MGTDTGDAAATVTPLHGKVITTLADELRITLQAQGSVGADLLPGGTAPAVWRAAARAAAKQLNRPVETGAMNVDEFTHVYAALRDWPRTPAEEEISMAAKRRMTDAAAASRPGLTTPPQP